MRRASLISRFACLVGIGAALPALFACLQHPLKQVEYSNEQEDQEGIAIAINKDVDILFVIDNSGSMGEEQGNLGEQFDKFIEVLEAEDVDANYRIGITTTDNGNPICDQTREAGKLQLSSCLSRLDEFEFFGDPPANKRQEACIDICDYENIGITPTATDKDSEEKPRPWLESIEGKTNLEGDISTIDAFRCFGPQGIAGCGFESHLESMWMALVRFNAQDDEAYGFMRDNALLSIVFVTDEVDCSFNPDYGSIFEPNGGKVFWNSQEDQQPTSAICWRAGVECTGGDDGSYAECRAVNKDENANVITDDAQAQTDAVLFPLEKYIDFVQEIEDSKGQEVLVAAITGVPETYKEDGVLVYETPADDRFGQNFGVAPGCSSDVAEAVPPVRLREFAEAFEVNNENNLYSVCATDYGPALEGIANAIRDRIQPSCMPRCVRDSNPVDPGVQFDCTLTQSVPRGADVERSEIVECVDGEVPDGEDVCFVALNDPNEATPETEDDLSDECKDRGWNLEFRVVRRDGVAPPGGTTVSATCLLSESPEDDCPNLPN